MLNKNRHTGTGLSEFLDYLKGIFTGKERNSFEKELEKDPFAADALEGFESLTSEELEKDLLNLSSRLNKRIEKRNRVLYFRIAASVAVILAVSTLYITLSDRQIKDYTGLQRVTEAVREEPEESEDSSEPLGEIIETMADDKKKADTGIEVKETDRIAVQEDFRELEHDEKLEISSREKSARKGSETASAFIPEKTEPEIIPAEVIAEDIQENAITVPEKGKSLAVPQMAVPKAARNAMVVQSDLAAPKLISGVVISSEDSLPIPGATVWIRGTNTGTVTDTDGTFILQGVEEEKPTLVASFIGMENKEISLMQNENLEIMLEPSQISLNEVVVVGTGNTTENFVSGAIKEADALEEETESTHYGAYPVDGIANFKAYIEENTIYPDTEVSRAVVVLKFVVTTAGRPSQVEVLRSPSEEFSREAIRLLEGGPDWIPAENEGKYIEDNTRIRIVFRKPL